MYHQTQFINGGIPLQANQKQLSLMDVYSDLEQYLAYDKPKLFKLFEQYINLDELIPRSFYNNYYKTTGHPREYKLSSMLSAFVLQKILSIPETSLLINLLNICSELREFCGFTSVPNASQFSRFKTGFLKELEQFFHSLVELTEPICQSINSELANILISDTTGFEAYVKENNPKFFDSIFRQAKKISKGNKDFDAHAYACSNMPKESFANKDIKLSYMNGHYCYSLKSNILTNGLGIIRNIDFKDDESNLADASSASSAKDKYDSTSLIPVLNTFFSKHPSFSYKYFIGDSGFDSHDNYVYLYEDKHMIPIIPLNPRNSKYEKPGFNELGIPTCPRNPNLSMKFDGANKEKKRVRLKWVCPKSKRIKINGKQHRITCCENPCTDSKYGRVYQTYLDNDYRNNSLIPRDSEQWAKLYKIRTIIERTNFMIKYPLCLQYTKTQNTTSLKSEVFLAGITQLLVLILAFKINKLEHPLSIKQFVA